MFFCVTLTRFPFDVDPACNFVSAKASWRKLNLARVSFLYFPFCEEVLSTPVLRVIHVDPVCTFPSVKDSI